MKTKNQEILATYLKVIQAKQFIISNDLKYNLEDLLIDQFIINNFSKLEKVIFHDYYYNGMSLKNIAKKNRLSYSYIRQVIHFSRIKILNYIEGKIT